MRNTNKKIARAAACASKPPSHGPQVPAWPAVIVTVIVVIVPVLAMLGMTEQTIITTMAIAILVGIEAVRRLADTLNPARHRA